MRNLGLAIILGLLIAVVIATSFDRADLAWLFPSLRPAAERQAQPRDAQVDGRWRIAQALLRGEELVSSIHGASIAQGRTAIATSISEQQRGGR